MSIQENALGSLGTFVAPREAITEKNDSAPWRNWQRAEDANLPTCELSIVMPCLNEAETLEVCIQKARGFMKQHGIDGEVIIADNGSTDGSQGLATKCGARVIDVPAKGYGSALLGGIRSARGRYIIMGDADDSYDFVNLMPFVEKLRNGRHQLFGRKGLDQQDAVGHAQHGPISRRRAGDVDDRKFRVDFTRGLRHAPAVKPPQQPDVGDQRRVVRPEGPQQRDGFFPRAGDRRLEAAIPQRFLQEKLDVRVILDDQDHGQGVLIQYIPR